MSTDSEDSSQTEDFNSSGDNREVDVTSEAKNEAATSTSTSASTSKRRCSCPQTVQQLWDVIANVIRLKHPCSLEKLQAHMYKKYQIGSNECERHLQAAVSDGLICVSNDIYSVPDIKTKLTDDGQDWYCYECHRPGDVLVCSTCWRVCHKNCSKDTVTEEKEAAFVCAVCKLVKSDSEGSLSNKTVTFTELNTLLSYTLNRLMDKGRESLCNLLPHEEDKLKAKLLLYKKVDLNDIQRKTRDKKYKRLSEFEADCRTVVHCVNILHGKRSAIADLAEQMFNDCIYDLNEIKQCSDCYRMSNETPGKYWFSTPCNPPHELVFAKQKGFPFWPAKVIKVENGLYDVRFFGSGHERALIEKDNIRPITASDSELKMPKKSTQLKSAMDELKRHQKLLEESKKIEDLIIRDAKRTRSRVSPAPTPTKKQKVVRKIAAKITRKAKNKVIPKKKSPIFKSVLSPIKEESFASIDDTSGTGDEQVDAVTYIHLNENGVATSDESSNLPLKRRGRPKGRTKLLTTRNSRNSMSRINICTQTNKELLKPFYVDKKEISPTTTAALIDAGVLPSNNPTTDEDSKSESVSNEKFVSNGLETAAETESVTSQESQESSLSKTRPTRSLKPNSLIFTAGIQPISPHKHKKRRSFEPEISPKTPHLKAFGARRGRPPKVRVDPSLSSEASKNSPLLSSLLTNTLQASPSTPKTGKPKGRPRKYPLPPGSSSFLNISKRIPKKKIVLPPPPPGATCDCDARYRLHFQNLEDSLNKQYLLQLQKLKKEIDERDKEKLRLQIKLSALQNENEILRNKAVSSSTELFLRKQIDDIRDHHKLEIANVKRKQWCANCQKEAIYFCCWNTSYCSLECQQHDWHAQHKRSCRRAK